MNYQFKFYQVFERDIKELKKKYPHVKEDFDDFINNIQNHLSSNFTPIANQKGKLWKSRMKSSDMAAGESGGFRIISYYNRDKSPEEIIFVRIYAKPKIKDLKDKSLRELVKIIEAILDK
ncbi:MAG: hypothetical protein A2Y62_18035 [Candidatus Fischerbacteria bacterium RBG_13_37_8]|uniref:Addiction module toxin RelE n=1 Tax=Candidatus Fischerbacteria bacterium RBG_13_37_8 TaxID=1817863 RepID=A0A1F5VW42_9BACT|nr:MAG: hypothetical protein A2Y62_18035 [Candidatus Fischerbacteria bacterium RBG_13_37_8]